MAKPKASEGAFKGAAKPFGGGKPPKGKPSEPKGGAKPAGKPPAFGKAKGGGDKY